jgi:hypothetical protein
MPTETTIFNYTRRKFTPEEYEEEQRKPIWQTEYKDDGTSFQNFDDYEAYYVRVIEHWLKLSREKFKPIKREWAYAIQRFERFTERFRDLSTSKADPATTELPILNKGIIELVAMLFDSLPRPQFSSRQASEDELVGALNYYATEEMDANNFDMTMYRIGLDIQLCNLGVLHQIVDYDDSGPFKHPGRILFRRIEPRYCHPDPFGGALHFDQMKYFIHAEPFDIADIRAMFPERGELVDSEADYSLSDDYDREGDKRGDGGSGEGIISPTNMESGPMTPRSRGRSLLKQCWFHHDHWEFVAEQKTLVDSAGNTVEDKHPESSYDIDEDGYVKGVWIPKYPKGRMITIANGRLLVDQGNPYRHGQLPYDFYIGRPSTMILSPGDASFLIVIERKLNDIYTRQMAMAQANIEQPTIIDRSAFDSSAKWKNLEASATAIIPVSDNSRVQKLIPGEIPNFVTPLAAFLMNFFDDFCGLQGVQKGRVAEGSQLSADAISDLLGQGGTRPRMKGRFVEFGLKDTGYKLQWNIRETYPSGVKAVIQDTANPGQTKEVLFDRDAFGDDYAVIITAGSSLPGAKQSAYQQALTLYRENIVDDEYVLQTAQVSEADKIIQRKTDKELAKIEAQGAGRAMGLQLKQEEKQDLGPGRKELDKQNA